MNNLHYIKDSAWNTLTWSLGVNNACAVRDILKDDYKHHEWPTTTVKFKQVGTEIVHGGLKALAWDKFLFSNLFNGPVLFDMTQHVKAPDITVVTNNITENTLGLAALGYSAKHVYSNATEGMKHLRKALQWDYNNNPILSFKDLGKSVAYLANASLVVPVALCGYEHGAAAAAAAAALLFAANQSGRLASIGKHYVPTASGSWDKATLIEVAAKAAFVAGSCYQSEMYRSALLFILNRGG